MSALHSALYFRHSYEWFAHHQESSQEAWKMFAPCFFCLYIWGLGYMSFVQSLLGRTCVGCFCFGAFEVTVTTMSPVSVWLAPSCHSGLT